MDSGTPFALVSTQTECSTMPPLDISSARWFSQGRPDLPFKQRHSTPAVELSPGRYFIMGGIDNTKACPDSFIYNAEDHTYDPVPLKPCCVFEHAAALMNDGRVVTFGGRQASRITQAVNIISFETNSFRQYLSLKNSPKVLHPSVIPQPAPPLVNYSWWSHSASSVE